MWFRISVCVVAITVFVASAQADPPDKVAAPWGVSASSSSFRDHAEWFPKMSAAGITSVRLFPEWRGFEPKRGQWKWDDGDLLMKSAASNRLEITAILMGSPPGEKAVHAFPMDSLDDWSKYVSTVVDRYKSQVRYWEVWNEGNGGFNDGKHTTTDYARLAATTYEAARKADPKAQVGLTVASFDAPYLHQAILAMAKAGKADHFDFLCVHPYEIADGLADVDGEIPFLWMTHLLRDALKQSAPQRADVPIWISEVSRRVGSSGGHVVTEQEAAKSLAKIYTIALAQGIARTQWFEGRDPIGEDQGFGLLRRDGSPRDSYETLKVLTRVLGAAREYQGWLAMGRSGRGYGFVFEGGAGPILVAWMPAGMTDESTVFTADVGATNLVTRATTRLKPGDRLTLTDAPVILEGVPTDLLESAKSNRKRAFPWGGNYSSAKTVSWQAGTEVGGVFQTRRAACPTVKFADGSSGILLQGDIGHPVSFYVHPSFASIHTHEYYVRATVRRVAAGNVGMNLFNEVADSQGGSAYANVGQWFGTSNDMGWQTHTWHVKNACFSKMWGNDISIRPELSVPFVLGKVEVSTEPFEKR